MKLHKLTHKSIKPYGHIIDASCVRYKPGDNGFGILFSERSKGWRIAYLVLKKTSMARLENHPNTAETFEPVIGRAAIALAPHNRPDRFRVFLLDKPVVLKKGVWHNVAALTKKCDIKICEGIKVREVYHKLARPITPGR
jgi:ureidoglycolate hydrolase